MHPKLTIYHALFILSSLILASCSNTKFLTGDQLLYTGRNKVEVISPENIRNKKAANEVIQTITSYKPNNSLGGKRVLIPGGLWIYNYMKPREKRRLSKWFFKTFSVEPVLISQVNPELRSKKLKSELYNIGFFHSTVTAKIDTSSRNPRKAKITYTVKLYNPFVYNSISFAPAQDALDSLINSYGKKIKIKPDDVFSLSAVKSETKKITSLANERGYYYFNAGNIEWIADTLRVPGKIDLRIGRNKETMVKSETRKYDIRTISVQIKNPVDSLAMNEPGDSIRFDGISIRSHEKYFKPEFIARSIYFREGDTYSTTKHQQTIRRLNSYGVFKFINLQFAADKDTIKPQLDLMLELTPMKEVSLDLEGNVVTKSTGFSGPGVVATLAHRNLWGGANKLSLKLEGGVEWQWGTKTSSSLGTVSYNAGISSSIVFPRVIKPFKLFSTNHFNMPQTTVTLGFEFLNKIQYYRMSSLNLGYNYQWKRRERITHIYYPLNFNSITLLETTPEFDSILNANPYIRKSFEEQFIFGMKYNFIYDNSSSKRPNGFYFQGGISTSGNLIDLFKRISSDTLERPYSTLGNVYSQFLKLTTDFRYYRNIDKHSLAFRFYAGVGFPYSNSVVMPYVEQFYSGGSNSIRAFIARSLGPGGYHTESSSDIIDQTGDIKLEGNLEYRFALSDVMKGALFLDAGNVWLLNKDENRPDAEFHFNTFTNQLAVGTGFGLRFDFSFFILRFDVGFPLRNAYATDGRHWIPSAGDAFKEFLFNFAIGYPF
jgi:outer membrane protein assembly factor BamA